MSGCRQLSAKAVRVSYGMVYENNAATRLTSTERKSISSGDIFPKIIWEAQSGQNRGLRVRIWVWRPIPGGGVDFWLDPGIWGSQIGSGSDLRYFSFFRFEWF